MRGMCVCLCVEGGAFLFCSIRARLTPPGGDGEGEEDKGFSFTQAWGESWLCSSLAERC